MSAKRDAMPIAFMQDFDFRIAEVNAAYAKVELSSMFRLTRFGISVDEVALGKLKKSIRRAVEESLTFEEGGKDAKAEA